MILAVYARPNHPAGWGYCLNRDEDCGHAPFASRAARGTAHGYVVVVVACPTMDRVAEVTERLKQYPIDHEGHPWRAITRFDPWARGDDWYAGPYELVFCAEAVGSHLTNQLGHPLNQGDRPTYGDNRAVAYLTAEEVLAGCTFSKGGQP